jgi:3-phytase
MFAVQRRAMRPPLPVLTLLLHLQTAADSCFQPIQPVHHSAPLNDPDDPAIWLSPDNPAESLIIGTDKGANDGEGGRSDGGLAAFTTSGDLVANVSLRRPNNVDVEYGLLVGGSATDIAVTCERDRQAIRVYALPRLEAIDGGGLPAFEGELDRDRRCMGVGLYKRPHDGEIFVILSRKSGPSGTYLWQYRLSDDDRDGVVEALVVRQFGQVSDGGEIEAVVVDDIANRIFYADEGCCIRAYAADPADDEGQLTADELATFGHEGFQQDREGISIYARGASSPRMDRDDAAALADDFKQTDPLPGFLFVSDQQRTGTFRVFCREAPHVYLDSIQLADTENSDGSEVTSFSLGPGFESGLFVAMSDVSHRFNFYSWASIASCLDGASEVCETAQANIIGPEDSGGEPFAVKILAVAVLVLLSGASFQM